MILILFLPLTFTSVGSFSKHLLKMVEKTSRDITRAENFQRFFETRQYRACWMGENTGLRRSKTNDNKIMYEFNDTSLARCSLTNKSKTSNTSGLHLYALLSHQTLSVIAPSFFKLVFVKPPGRMSRWSFKCLNLCAKFSKCSLCLLYPQYPKFGPPKWGVLH